ncbi:MAG: hypothetical protein AAF411_11315 [Myxococcota bacterium]
MSAETANAPPLGAAVAVLWLVLAAAMLLHFNYDVSGIRFGIPLADPEATGIVPWSNVVIKTIFYVVPLLLCAAALGPTGRVFRNVNFGLTIPYALAHVSHLITTATRIKNRLDIAQVVLLSAVLLISAQLIRLSWRWRKEA